MITDPDAYFRDGCGRCKRGGTPECSTQNWAQGLADLRKICLDVGLVEVVKWGHPAYTHNGKNIAILGAFRGDFHLSFMNASLIDDPQGVFVKRGEHTQTANVMKFTDNGGPAAMATTIIDYLERATQAADSGAKPVKATAPSVAMPDELVAALDADPALSEAFHALTPGRQRMYYIYIGEAKQSATRSARIAKCSDRIFAGKGFNER